MSKRYQYGKIGDIRFLINPTDVIEKEEPKYAKREILGRQVMPMDYVGGEGETYEISLLFDDNYAREIGHTVNNLEKIKALTKKDSNTSAPPVVLLQYGQTVMNVIVLSRTVKHIYRDSSNKTKRAIVTLTLREWVDEEFSRTPREDKGEQIYLVETSNETFRTIALKALDDPQLWPAIVVKNKAIALKLEGFLIPVGTKIIIPDWDFIRDNYMVNDEPGLRDFRRWLRQH